MVLTSCLCTKDLCKRLIEQLRSASLVMHVLREYRLTQLLNESPSRTTHIDIHSARRILQARYKKPRSRSSQAGVEPRSMALAWPGVLKSRKPMPSQGKPKPGLSGQAAPRARTSLTWNLEFKEGCDVPGMANWQFPQSSGWKRNGMQTESTLTGKI